MAKNNVTISRHSAAEAPCTPFHFHCTRAIALSTYVLERLCQPCIAAYTRESRVSCFKTGLTQVVQPLIPDVRIQISLSQARFKVRLRQPCIAA